MLNLVRDSLLAMEYAWVVSTIQSSDEQYFRKPAKIHDTGHLNCAGIQVSKHLWDQARICNAILNLFVSRHLLLASLKQDGLAEYGFCTLDSHEHFFFHNLFKKFFIRDLINSL
jgi:hypothetical protein